MSFRLTYSYTVPENEDVEASTTRFDEPDEDDELDPVGVTLHMRRHRGGSRDTAGAASTTSSDDTIDTTLQTTPEEGITDDATPMTDSSNANLTDPYIIERASAFEKLPENLKERVINGLQEATNLIDKYETMMDDDSSITTCRASCCSCLKKCLVPSSSALTKDIVPPHLSLPYELGLHFSREMFFPALPFFFRDMWLLIELLVTLVQLVLACLSISGAANLGVTTVFVTLTAINTVLAVIDVLIYYYELGSYKYMLKSCMSWKRNAGTTDDSAESRQYCKKIRLSEKRRKQLNQWFEVIRTVLSELLLYPLIVFDLYDVGRSGFVSQTLEFSIFMISSVYLVLSVYMARIVIIIFIFKNIIKLLRKTKHGSSSIQFIARFFMHTFAQIVAHLSCIVAVGLKIHIENENNQGYSASPFLWVSIIGGWVVPFAGVAIFFLANYFWTQQYSIGLCIEMMSLIQVPNIAQSLFKSTSDIEGDAMAKSEAMLEKMKFTKVKDDYSAKLKKAKTITKLVYPGKIIPFLMLTVLYVSFLIVFFVCLILERNPKSGEVRILGMDNFPNLFIVGCIVIIAISNIQILLLSPWLPHVTIFTIIKKMRKSK